MKFKKKKLTEENVNPNKKSWLKREKYANQGLDILRTVTGKLSKQNVSGGGGEKKEKIGVKEPEKRKKVANAKRGLSGKGKQGR